MSKAGYAAAGISLAVLTSLAVAGCGGSSGGGDQRRRVHHDLAR